ncbi:MAG: hypothetical protein ABR587_17350 [Candidatus Binatia bacterium]
MPEPDKHPWKVLLELTPAVVRLLVSDAQGDILKAQLPSRPDHCRALMFMLEALALWHGRPLSVAVSVDYPVDHSFGMGPFGDDWPDASALVRFEFIGASSPAGSRISGIGDFEVVRRMQRWSGHS